jgi:hypothetical protein
MLLVLPTTYLWLRRRQVFFFLHLIISALCTICFSSPFAVFQRLANDKFCERNRCIVITVSNNSHPMLSIFIIFSLVSWYCIVNPGKRLSRYSNKKACALYSLSSSCIFLNRYPNFTFFFHPRFLRYLVELLHLPAYCLVDSDPYGFDILATYKFGSLVGMIYLMLLCSSISIVYELNFLSRFTG